MSYNAQRDRILRTFRLARPASLHNPVAETFAHLVRVRTIRPVYLDTAAHRYEPEHIIAINRLSTGATAHSPFEILDDLRRRERQAEIHAGSDDQRLANGERRGLHGVHCGHDLLHADGIADGRLLDDRHELIGDGREDVLDGLRQHDGLQRLAARQAEAAGGLRLAGVDALDTGADDLAEVGSGVQRQRNDARQKALKANEAEQLERRQRYAAEHNVVDDKQLHQHRCRAEHLHIDGSENAQRLNAAHAHQRQHEGQQEAEHDRQERQRDGADHALLEQTSYAAQYSP